MERWKEEESEVVDEWWSKGCEGWKRDGGGQRLEVGTRWWRNGRKVGRKAHEIYIYIYILILSLARRYI